MFSPSQPPARVFHFIWTTRKKLCHRVGVLAPCQLLAAISAVSSHGPWLCICPDSGILMPGITVGLSSVSLSSASRGLQSRTISSFLTFSFSHLTTYRSLYCCNPNPSFPIIAIMRYSFAAAALAAATLTTNVNGSAMPQASSSGCQPSFEGSFQIKVVSGSTPATPRMKKRAQVCHPHQTSTNLLS